MTKQEKNSQPPELVKRINELAQKQKMGTLTDAEAKEQGKLRQEYLANFRQGLKDRIEHTKLYDKNGNEITSRKVRNLQQKNGWRKD
ncbi:DUF896 domain-containing protein [Bombilactobacillus thymidiniphilus]|uniref:UPF0291 protein MOO47_06825 n=1 Tax=Bombilactobacillus thymidiniphilus TaxID=2923363 RepID=A0ABY4PDB0_9LACO|nr:DUF896 domain-containing protein [Bombilactobacillus thymidiniphilus]UQS83481.1 DUF896 domain-containing protein [Bombilactobacillus thymidiniphilus]